MVKAVVLFSGGLDSLAALVKAVEDVGKENVTAIYVYLGHRYAKAEVVSASEIASALGVRFKVIHSPFVGESERDDAFIPYRNAILILAGASVLSSMLEPDEDGYVYIQNVQVGEESVYDRTDEFNSIMQFLIDHAGDREINIITPFRTYTKGQIVKWLKSRVSKDIIKLTVGCYNTSAVGNSVIVGNCGHCRACLRRWVALEYAGFDARSWFINDPLKNPYIPEYIEKMREGYYPLPRVVETFKVFSKYGLVKDFKVVAVDFDGVLSHGGMPWSLGEPNYDVIRKINKMYDEGNYIVIYTSRPNEDREKIAAWLQKYGVKYNRIVTGKIYYDLLIDDKAVNVDVLSG